MSKLSNVIIEEFNKDELNKDTSTIMIRFSMDRDSKYYVCPEYLGKFVKIIKNNGYDAIAIPIECEVEIKKGK